MLVVFRGPTMHTTGSRSFSLSLSISLLALLALPEQAAAAEVLLVCDEPLADVGIAGVLMGDGHTVTTATNDDAAPTSVLAGDLSAYDLIVWSPVFATRNDPAVYANLTSYVSAGGRVFVTGYDATLGETMLLAFLGVTGSYDFPTAPGPIVSVDNALTTGVLDIRGVTPTGGYTDRDGLTGLGSDTMTISPDAGGRGSEWTLRTVGSGLIAWVSDGIFNATHASWTTTTGPVGARAYNAAVRNFAFSAGGAGGPCTGEDTACTTTGGRAGVCHMDRCCAGCWNATLARCFSGTTGVECGVNGGACISCSDGMPCTTDVCTAGACSNPMAPAGTACEDGMFCNVGETCDSAGTCRGGIANGCADATACTVDTCDEAMNACVHTPGGGCLIGGACTMPFVVNTANPCEVCDPTRNTMGWSPRTVGIPCGIASCTVIGGYGTLTDVGRCDAAAVCVRPTPMVCPSGRCTTTFPSTACNPACATGTCPGGLTCSTATMRCVTPAAIGEACAAGSECTSGFCADGVCCMSACSELCDSCDVAGSVGTCVPSPEGHTCGLPICVAGSLTLPGACDVAGMCVRMGATTCPSGLCTDATTCNPNCSPASCPAGQICTAAMRCVTPADDGETCTADDECVSGNCADGVCCNSACADICESCNQAGREGLCTPYTANTDPENECPIGSICSGGRACAVGMMDAGAADAGPPDAGAPPDTGTMSDATVAIDTGIFVAPPRRASCACRSAGRPQAERGALAAISMLALLAARRRRR